MPEPGVIPCPTCKGCGTIKCDCPDTAIRTIEGHPLNVEYSKSTWGREGFVIQQCRRCGRVFGLDYQHDYSTGSDDHVHDYGFVDPMGITERHSDR